MAKSVVFGFTGHSNSQYIKSAPSANSTGQFLITRGHSGWFVRRNQLSKGVHHRGATSGREATPPNGVRLS